MFLELLCWKKLPAEAENYAMRVVRVKQNSTVIFNVSYNVPAGWQKQQGQVIILCRYKQPLSQYITFYSICCYYNDTDYSCFTLWLFLYLGVGLLLGPLIYLQECASCCNSYQSLCVMTSSQLPSGKRLPTNRSPRRSQSQRRRRRAPWWHSAWTWGPQSRQTPDLQK